MVDIHFKTTLSEVPIYLSIAVMKERNTASFKMLHRMAMNGTSLDTLNAEQTVERHTKLSKAETGI